MTLDEFSQYVTFGRAPELHLGAVEYGCRVVARSRQLVPLEAVPDRLAQPDQYHYFEDWVRGRLTEKLWHLAQSSFGYTDAQMREMYHRGLSDGLRGGMYGDADAALLDMDGRRDGVFGAFLESVPKEEPIDRHGEG